MTPFSFPGQSGFYSGKVRDVYSIGNEYIVMIASDRISAFDVILPRTIPFKGQVLNQIASKMLGAGADIFITADYKYHEFFDADNKIIIADIGHFESEQFTQQLLQELIQKRFADLPLRLTSVNTNPVRYFV